MDDYPVMEGNWEWLPDSADTRLDNPRYIYFGANGKLIIVCGTCSGMNIFCLNAEFWHINNETDNVLNQSRFGINIMGGGALQFAVTVTKLSL